MSKEYDTGVKGENIAAGFLEQKGYDIIERNWRFKKLEVDIIAKYNNVLIIVEVKSRSGGFYEDLSEAVPKKKQKFLYDACEAWIEENDEDINVRFDIITVIFVNNNHELTHIEDAFRPGW